MSNLTPHAAMQGVEVLSFDLDDTLWDCPPVIVKAEEKLLTWFAENAPKVVEFNNGDTLAARRAQVVESHPEIACDMTLLRHKMIELSLVDAGYSSDLADEGFDVFYRARSEVVLYENTVNVLDALGAQFKMAVITNGNADLTMIGLDDKFEHIQRASIDNAPKPHPQMFLTCIEHFGIEPSALAHIGDNIVTDVQGAQAVGARTVWYNQAGQTWPDTEKGPSATVTSLQELSDLFLSEHA